MKWQNLKKSLADFWAEFSRIKYGLVGVGLFILFVLIVIFEPFVMTFPETNERWRDITYWETNPVSAPPVWVNFFSKKDRATKESLDAENLETKEVANMIITDTTVPYNYTDDIPTQEIYFRAVGKGRLSVEVTMVRPDGHEIQLTRKNLYSSGESKIMLALSKGNSNAAYDFGKVYDPENAKNVKRSMTRPMDVYFAKAQEGMFLDPEPLHGEYQFKVSAVAVGEDATIKDINLLIPGSAFGIMGTDASKRDIWSGVIAGIKWAMLIGLLTAVVAVTIGVTYGVTSAYFGGWVDSIMMRIQEIFMSIPLLPVLIVLSAIFNPSIWILIMMMCALNWVGSVRTVRSMGLQIKEETYVEAARALDASGGRIIFKHMVPQLIPFAFASMALRVPGAIMAEASISLLGLGDSTIVTWGQILQNAMSSNAVLQGLWWWIIPPGLFIALMGMTFAFMGFAMDTILNPKLKTR